MLHLDPPLWTSRNGQVQTGSKAVGTAPARDLKTLRIASDSSSNCHRGSVENQSFSADSSSIAFLSFSSLIVSVFCSAVPFFSSRSYENLTAAVRQMAAW